MFMYLLSKWALKTKTFNSLQLLLSCASLIKIDFNTTFAVQVEYKFNQSSNCSIGLLLQ